MKTGRTAAGIVKIIVNIKLKVEVSIKVKSRSHCKSKKQTSKEIKENEVYEERFHIWNGLHPCFFKLLLFVFLKVETFTILPLERACPTMDESMNFGI